MFITYMKGTILSTSSPTIFINAERDTSGGSKATVQTFQLRRSYSVGGKIVGVNTPDCREYACLCLLLVAVPTPAGIAEEPSGFAIFLRLSLIASLRFKR